MPLTSRADPPPPVATASSSATPAPTEQAPPPATPRPEPSTGPAPSPSAARDDLFSPDVVEPIGVVGCSCSRRSRSRGCRGSRSDRLRHARPAEQGRLRQDSRVREHGQRQHLPRTRTAASRWPWPAASRASSFTSRALRHLAAQPPRGRRTRRSFRLPPCGSRAEVAQALSCLFRTLPLAKTCHELLPSFTLYGHRADGPCFCFGALRPFGGPRSGRSRRRHP